MVGGLAPSIGHHRLIVQGLAILIHRAKWSTSLRVGSWTQCVHMRMLQTKHAPDTLFAIFSPTLPPGVLQINMVVHETLLQFPRSRVGCKSIGKIYDPNKRFETGHRTTVCQENCNECSAKHLCQGILWMLFFFTKRKSWRRFCIRPNWTHILLVS